jgi:hypothetical protein
MFSAIRQVFFGIGGRRVLWYLGEHGVSKSDVVLGDLS